MTNNRVYSHHSDNSDRTLCTCIHTNTRNTCIWVPKSDTIKGMFVYLYASAIVLHTSPHCTHVLVSVHIHVHIQPSCWASSGTTRRELQWRATNIMLVSHTPPPPSLSLSLSLFLSPSLSRTHTHHTVLWSILLLCIICLPLTCIVQAYINKWESHPYGQEPYSSTQPAEPARESQPGKHSSRTSGRGSH